MKSVIHSANKRTVYAALGLAISVALSGPALAQTAPITLKIAHPLPPVATAHAKFLGPWTQKVEADCAGKLKFQIFPAMQLGGTPPQLYDQAKDGVADMVWTVLGYTPGRFTATEAFELPFMTKTAAGSSRAFWEYALTNNLMTTGELRDVKPLALHVHDEGLIHTTGKQVKTLADLKGLKLRGPTRATTKMLHSLGAVPVGMPVTQVAESLSKGVIEGAIVPWEIVPATKVHELTKFHTETDPKARALYTATFIFAMNKGAYDKLPADVKTCIDRNSGAELSAWIGKVWDESAAPAKKLAADRGNQFYTVPASELALWEKASASVVDEWVKEAATKNLDGQVLLRSAKSLIERFDAAK
jgi:TRAP-type transport system periplasmic protein